MKKLNEIRGTICRSCGYENDLDYVDPSEIYVCSNCGRRMASLDSIGTFTKEGDTGDVPKASPWNGKSPYSSAKSAATRVPSTTIPKKIERKINMETKKSINVTELRRIVRDVLLEMVPYRQEHDVHLTPGPQPMVDLGADAHVCSYCGSELPPHSDRCEECGHDQSMELESKGDKDDDDEDDKDEKKSDVLMDSDDMYESAGSMRSKNRSKR